ncbi:hypothetical protein N7478_012274 [Penicillium angulare]|uniref:uncharacterized protein n=1 Tax=Penicillium angulare TaxID=116970 RepID=UPI0025402DAE|nr:uncharacterized protein N7478_012274 [Penicillium angulare]KAJ5259293.1 hypothetical protein N7478_012274 [Penicillium angulare]
MDSPTRPILSPSKVLNQVSPDRMNQQNISASPSLPSDLFNIHHKGNKGVSEVQAKVAFLNSLSRGSPGAQAQAATNHAALQRAILGREEAESALTTVQEELSEAQSRERRISERLESLLEELHGTKERQAHERSIFEKEIRKARKEAFRAGSTLVNLQEELKHAKSESKALKYEVSAERESKDKAKQEAFERAYALAGLTEELEVLKGKLRSMEASNHSNKLEVRAHEIRKEDFGRLSLAEGDLAFLTTPRRPKRAATDSIRSFSQEGELEEVAEATPPKRQRLSEVNSPVKDSPTTTITPASETGDETVDDLKDELHFERRRRIEAEDMIHYMNIECQFEQCSCRIAERDGRRYIYDAEYFEKFQKPQLEAKAKIEAKEQARLVAQAQADEEEARRVEAEAQAQAEAQAEAEAKETRRAQAEAQAQAEAAEAAARRAEVEAQARAKAEAEAARRAQAEAQARADAEAEQAAQRAQAEEQSRRAAEEAEAEAIRRARISHPAPQSSHTPSVEPPATIARQHELSMAVQVKPEPTEPPERMPIPEEPLVTFSPETGTFKTFPSPIRDNARPPPPPRRDDNDNLLSPTPKNQSVRSLHGWRESASSTQNRESFTPSEEPRSSRMSHRESQSEKPAAARSQPREYIEERPARTRDRVDHPSHSTTKRVPLREAIDSQSLPSFLPDQPINREEALAQIRARRGRARSKVRSVSANEVTGRAAGSTGSTATTPGRGPRRIPNLQTNTSRSENDLGERRDMSAPIRMFRR